MSRARWYLMINTLVAVWLVATAVVVLVHRSVPAGGWLMVHLLFLGAVSTAIVVWSQHFADALLRRPVPGGRVFHGIRLLAHTIGAGLVVGGVVANYWPLTVAGGVLVGIVAISHGVVIFLQARGALANRFGPLVRYYIAACVALVAGVGVGVVMARATVADELHDRLYPAHLALNVLGWVGLTVVGTVILLWPTVLRTRVSDGVGVTARRALWLSIAGLVVICSASLFDVRPLFALGVLIYVAGVSLVLIDGVRQARRAIQWTFASWSIGAGFIWFIFCTIAFGVVVVQAASWADATTNIGWLVGTFAAGFAAQILVGALSHLLPVVLGGGPELAKRAAFELNRAALYRVVVVNAGIVLYLLPVPSAARVVISFVVFAVLVMFLVLAVRAVVDSRPRAARSRAESVTGALAAHGSEVTPAPARYGGAFTAAVTTLVLALTVGIAVDPAAAGLQLGSPDSSVVPTGRTTVVEMSMKNMRFTPDLVEIPAGDELVIRLTNNDNQVHDLVLENTVSSGLMNPGQTIDVEVGVVGSNLDGWCSIAGHRMLGMVISIVAIGGTPATADTPASTAASGHDHATSEGPSAAENLDLMTEPDPGFTARDALLAPAPSETIHKYTFTVREQVTEVAPGVTQRLWTFNGTAPGPTLRGKVGDIFEITLINDGTIGHSIDFHAGALAPNQPMRTIQPGERLTYTFTATRSGIWLYHCSTMPMSLHIANGMFGTVIIDPPELPTVDREFVLVQSEYYLGPQGAVADVARIATQNPDLVVFNGYANQYLYRPLHARVGERVRVWILDAGPNVASAFHIVGGQFDTVFFEGDYQIKNGGSTGTGGSQVIALQPAQGGFVELVFPEAGDYSLVSHIMSDAEKGAVGIFHITQ